MNTRPLLLAAMLTLACDSAEDAATKAKDAAKTSQELAGKAADGTKAAIEGSKEAYGKGKEAVDEIGAKAKAGADAVKEGTDKAKALWADVPDTGELSSTAQGWIDKTAKGSEGTMASIVASGEQIAPVAKEISDSASKVVDSDHMLEPIYQEVDEGDTAEVDKAIGDMPRVEVIDGLTIGFQQLDEKSADAMVKERGYLVTWREGDHLIGFVYRSKRTIDLEALVAETPRIVELVRKAI
jgi:hypothetical protein